MDAAVSASRTCPEHGVWVDDGTTESCPECLAEVPQWARNLDARLVALIAEMRATGVRLEPPR